MVKVIATLLVMLQRFCGLFEDNDPYDPSWMKADAWRETRV